MPDVASFALFLAAALVLAVTPGPGIFYVAARTLAGGRGEGIASSLGTGVGGMVHVLAGAAGVSALVLASAELFAALKLLGAAYLVWIGVQAIRSAGSDSRAALTGSAESPPLGARRAFREGVMVEALNPKTAAFFLAFLPQFVDPASGGVVLAFIALGTISVALNTLADLVVAFGAGHLRESLESRPRVVRRVRVASGAAMVALGLGVLFARRPGLP